MENSIGRNSVAFCIDKRIVRKMACHIEFYDRIIAVTRGIDKLAVYHK